MILFSRILINQILKWGLFMTWIKLHTDIIDDEKVNKMNAKLFKNFIFLLCYAKELDQNGALNAPISDMSWRLRIKETELNITIEQLVELNIISNNGNHLAFTHWEKRQYSESYKRVTRYREKHRYINGKNNSKLTRDTETETDVTPTPCDSNESLRGAAAQGKVKKDEIPYAEIIADLNSKTDSNFHASATGWQRLIRARWHAGFRLEDFQRVHEAKAAEWKNDPKMSQYLTPKTLYRAENFDRYVNQAGKPGPEAWRYE